MTHSPIMVQNEICHIIRNRKVIQQSLQTSWKKVWTLQRIKKKQQQPWASPRSSNTQHLGTTSEACPPRVTQTKSKQSNQKDLSGCNDEWPKDVATATRQFWLPAFHRQHHGKPEFRIHLDLWPSTVSFALQQLLHKRVITCSLAQQLSILSFESIFINQWILLPAENTNTKAKNNSRTE